MDTPRCPDCGGAARLGPDGSCAWKGGCEHRQMQADVRAAVFDADYRFHFETLDCGHTRAEHRDQWAQIAVASEVDGEGYTYSEIRVRDGLPPNLLDGIDWSSVTMHLFTDADRYEISPDPDDLDDE